MFPTGTAGAALLVLRVSVAATLVANVIAHGPAVTPLAILLALAIPVICLCSGLLTPYCSALSCILQLYLLLAGIGGDRFHLALSIVDSGVLAVLGPGAYSIDARIFGRRLLTLPSSR